MIGTQDRLTNYFRAFEVLSELRRESEPVWLGHLRREAWEQFSAAGFPTTRNEDWRFTSLNNLVRTPFRRSTKGAEGLTEQAIKEYRLPAAACELVFVNGCFAPQFSNLESLPPGLEVESLAQTLADDPAKIEQHMGRYVNLRRDAFAALNTALWEDGAYIRIGRSAMIDLPIHLLYVSVGGVGPVMTHPRALIIAEEASQAAVVEEYVSVGDDPAFCNAVTEVAAGDGSVVSHCLIERENLQSFNISTLRIEQGRGANLASHSVLLGGGLVRNNVHPVLAGEGSECLINGLFIGAGRQHLDNYMLVEHASPNCSSRQFYNGILDGEAHGVFHGRIIVHKDAQKTDAKQTNRNLLLSDDARIDTKPQLEIHADDVKCTHGATIGRIEDELLFYLRSRGLAEAEARSLLLYAFAGECLERMHEMPVRSFVEKLIRKRVHELTETTHETSREVKHLSKKGVRNDDADRPATV